MRKLFRTRDFVPDPERDISDEIEAHLEFKVEELMATGLSEEEAKLEAMRLFGDRKRIQSEASSHAKTRERTSTLIDRTDTLIRDIRYALRRMARSRGFTTAAVLSLAIGIGANTAIFSVVNAFLIRKAPFTASEELVRIYTSYPHITPYRNSAYPDFISIREMNDVFSDVGAQENLINVTRFGDEPQRIMLEAVSAGLLPMLGVEPVLGRNFLPEEDVAPMGDAVVLLGNGFWQRAFGGDPDILGRTLEVGSRSFTIIGVAPSWFQSTTLTGISMDGWIPVTASTAVSGTSEEVFEQRGWTRYGMTARLAPGVTVEEARARLDVLAVQLQEAYPETNQGRSFNLIPSNDVIISPEVDTALGFTAAFLMAVVGLVLLLACTNLASFLLARGIERRKEVAIRLALGAERGRLVRQLLTETVLLGLVGGLAGLFVARVSLGLLMAFQPPIPVPLSLDLGLDQTVLLFTLAVSGLAGLIFGLAPALQSTRPDVAPTLKDAGVVGGKKRLSLQAGLVALQMAVSVILLVGGGLFVRSLIAAQEIDPGFSTEDAGIAWIELSTSGVPYEEWEVVRGDLERRIRSQPGIQEVTSTSRIPLSLGNSFQNFTIPGVDPPSDNDGHSINYSSVSPGFFEVLEIPLLTGREFSLEDQPESPNVVVVSEEMARVFWPGEIALGKEIFRGEGEQPITVVGVAGNTKHQRLGEETKPFLYFPQAQVPSSNLQFLVRGPVSQGELAATLRRVIREANPGLVVMEVKTMTEHLSLLLFAPRVAAFLLGVFGALALILSSIGLYGVVSFSVSRRIREVGIRMSLGAGHREVVRMVVGRAMGVVLVGGVCGLFLAYLLARIIQRFLFGVQAGDPVTMTLVPILLGAVALTAALIPARKASQVNPVEALRVE